MEERVNDKLFIFLFSDLLRASIRADQQIKMKNQLEMVKIMGRGELQREIMKRGMINHGFADFFPVQTTYRRKSFPNEATSEFF